MSAMGGITRSNEAPNTGHNPKSTCTAMSARWTRAFVSVGRAASSFVVPSEGSTTSMRGGVRELNAAGYRTAPKAAQTPPHRGTSSRSHRRSDWAGSGRAILDR